MSRLNVVRKKPSKSGEIGGFLNSEKFQRRRVERCGRMLLGIFRQCFYPFSGDEIEFHGGFHAWFLRD